MARHRLSFAKGHMGLSTCKTKPKPPPPPPGPVWVPWSQTRYPHQAVSVAEMYHVPWQNPQNCEVEDGNITMCAFEGSGESEMLRGFDFQFSMPVGATCTGAFLELKKRSVIPPGTSDQGVYLLLHPYVQSENKYNSANWPPVLTWFEYGSDSDTWGITLTESVVNDIQFTVGISAMRLSGDGAVAIDVMRLTLNGMELV